MSQIFDSSPYGYVPTQWICIIFLVLFGISTFCHTTEAIYFRAWWLLPTATLSGLLEILGWSARLWSSISPDLPGPFSMQITCTILGPTPLLAINFVVMERLIELLGEHYSRITSKWYTIIFCTSDVISLIVQGVGGGLAATAASNNDIVGADRGGNIMLGGIVFQLFVITVYVFAASEYFTRYFTNRPIRNEKVSGTRGQLTTRIKLMCCALVAVTTVLWIRSVYRTIELADGWNGRVIETEVYFNVLDGAMVVLAMWTLNVLHPEILVPKLPRKKMSDEELKEIGSEQTLG